MEEESSIWDLVPVYLAAELEVYQPLLDNLLHVLGRHPAEIQILPWAERLGIRSRVPWPW